MFRVLVPARIGTSSVVPEDHMSPADQAAAGSYVACIAGALSRREYLEDLASAGFTDASVTFAAEAAPGLHSRSSGQLSLPHDRWCRRAATGRVHRHGLPPGQEMAASRGAKRPTRSAS